LKLSKELSELKDQQAEKLTTVSKLEEEKARLEKAVNHLTNECNEANSRAELAEKQYEGLKGTIRSLQTENDALQKENRQLETRVVSEKEKVVSEVNSLTELVESLRKERDMLRSLQKQEAKRTTNNNSWFGSASSKTNIKSPLTTSPNGRSTLTVPIEEEDSTRKFGDLKIVLPSAPKFSLAAHSSAEGICVRYDSSGSGNDADLVVTAGTDATVKVWDTAKGILKSTLRGSSGYPFLCCDVAGKLVAGGGTDKTCRVWSLKTDRMVSVAWFQVGLSCEFLILVFSDLSALVG
jgi:WD40 repeat protein